MTSLSFPSARRLRRITHPGEVDDWRYDLISKVDAATEHPEAPHEANAWPEKEDAGRSCGMLYGVVSFLTMMNTRAIHIDRENWLAGTFARLTRFSDVLRAPEENFSHLSKEEQDKLRQTQVFENEVIRVLGHHQNHSLVMKYDQVVGWIPRSSYILALAIQDFELPKVQLLSPSQFLESWKGTPYLWGGLSPTGIDCSGLTQWYFLVVHDRVIPRNSKDQRKVGQPKSLDEIDDHDLIFCHRIGKGVHHVGIFFDSKVWHARTEEGVVAQELSDFKSLYEIEAVVTLLSARPGQ